MNCSNYWTVEVEEDAIAKNCQKNSRNRCLSDCEHWIIMLDIARLWCILIYNSKSFFVLNEKELYVKCVLLFWKYELMEKFQLMLCYEFYIPLFCYSCLEWTTAPCHICAIPLSFLQFPPPKWHIVSGGALHSTHSLIHSRPFPDFPQCLWSDLRYYQHFNRCCYLLTVASTRSKWLHFLTFCVCVLLPLCTVLHTTVIGRWKSR